MTTHNWSQERSEQVASRTIERLDSLEVVRRKGVKLIVRLPLEAGGTVIVKFWGTVGIRDHVKKSLRITDADHEWRNLNRAVEIGLRAPRPHGFVRLKRGRSTFHSALISEDMGVCKPCLLVMKHLASCGDDKELQRLEEDVIRLTGVMVAGGLLDSDHGLMNIAVTGSGEVIRLDLEMARSVNSVSRHQGLYGKMLGRLITTYAFAVQPDVTRISSFAQRIDRALEPSRKVKTAATEYLHKMMLEQEKVNAQKISPTLSW